VAATGSAGTPNVFGRWRRMWTSLTTARPDAGLAAGKPFADEPPLRAELFSTDQMARHGVALASDHRLQPGRVPERLLSRLAANERVLIETCDRLTTAVAAKHRITPAGCRDWPTAPRPACRACTTLRWRPSPTETGG
jgi:hypothetical protein